MRGDFLDKTIALETMLRRKDPFAIVFLARFKSIGHLATSTQSPFVRLFTSQWALSLVLELIIY